VSADPTGESPRRWRALGWLALACLLAMSTWFSGSAVVPQVRVAWHLSPTAAAWLTIAVQLGFVAGSLALAITNLADLVSPRAIFPLAALGAAAVNAAFAGATGAGIAIALRFATGFFLAGVYPTGLKIMATWFRRDRGRALGIMVGALTLGSAMPHLITGLGAALPWRVAVVATSALTLLGGAVAALGVRDGPFPFPRARFDPAEAGRVLRQRGVRLACIGYFGHMWELYAMWTWFLVFLAESFARAGAGSRAAASLGTFAVIGIGAIGCWIGGIMGDRWGRTRTTALAMALSGACAVAIGFTFGGPPALVLGLGLVWGVTVVADSAQFSTMVTELSDQAYVGTALALQLGIGFTLTVVTIWLMPALKDAWSWRWAFAVLAPGPALGVIAMLRLKDLPEARVLAGGRG
jgi:MFS family permease